MSRKSEALGPRFVRRRRVKGFPKRMPCLVCGRARRATWPGDRIHPACRRARGASEPEFVSLTNYKGA